MFRNGLLVTTALIVAASASAGQPRAPTQTRMRDIVADRDVNTEFLCQYGGTAVSAHYIGSAASFSSTWTHIAVPITGHGKTVSRIIVKEAPSASTSSIEFKAGIYSNSASGPGKLLSGGTGNARNNCGKVTVRIKPVKLARNTTYWVEERVHRGVSDLKNEVYWAGDPNAKLKAYEQTHSAYNYFGNSSSYTSPWMAEAVGPYVRVR